MRRLLLLLVVAAHAEPKLGYLPVPRRSRFDGFDSSAFIRQYLDPETPVVITDATARRMRARDERSQPRGFKETTFS